LGKHRYVIDGERYDVDVHVSTGSHAEVSVNGQRYSVQRELVGASREKPRAAVPHVLPVARRTAPSGAEELRAPMAGLVLRVDVAPGARVEAGATVLVLDAMKMENSIRAPHAGVVAELAVSAGATVLTGALLARITPEGD
jgi:biotin carboxyl carrier protein